MSSHWVTRLLVVVAVWGVALALWPSDYRAVATVHTSSGGAADSVVERFDSLRADPDAVAALLGAEPALTGSAQLEVSRQDDTVLVTTRHQDPRLAQAMADSVAVAVAGPRPGIERTQLAQLPTDPRGPSRLVLFGAGGGIALGLGLTLAARAGRGHR